MLRLYLKRIHENDHNVTGRLSVVNESSGNVEFECATLELPFLDNQTDISSIPAGVYELEKYESHRLGAILRLKNVPGREYIYIHIGNYASGAGGKNEIKGCILVGESIADLNNDGIRDIRNSRNAFNELWAILGNISRIDIGWNEAS